MAGALLLGRVFSPWNVVAYGFGDRSGNAARSFSEYQL
jgi:hypothetical protein